MGEPRREPGRPARILLVDDDPAIRSLVSDILLDSGHRVEAVASAEEALARLAADAWNLLITDVRLPGMDGRALLGRVRDRWPALPVVVLTAFGSIQDAVEAMRLGASDYLTKPIPSPDALRAVVDRTIADRSSLLPKERHDPEGIVVHDPAFRRVVDLARAVAPRQTTVLITGESGTGKEVVAKLIHDLSPRKDKPFVAVNCAALVKDLLASELFGHERGAFTGADRRRVGRFEQASGGTLFLDEVAEMDPSLQARLLRAIQERVIERVGGSEAIRVDVRIIAATNRDLEREVAAGRFRDDLFYRLHVFPIHVPPLRERRSDILPLVRHFMAQQEARESGRKLDLTSEAQGVLASHDWPGNVRELANVIERAAILSPDGSIRPEHVEISRTKGPNVSDKATLRDLERQAVIEALALEGGNRKQAARRLGIALRTLQYKIKEYDLKGKF